MPTREVLIDAVLVQRLNMKQLKQRFRTTYERMRVELIRLGVPLPEDGRVGGNYKKDAPPREVLREAVYRLRFLSAIAEAFDISVPTARRWIEEAGLPVAAVGGQVRHEPLTPDELRDMHYAQEMPVRAMARLHGVSTAVMTKWLNDAGIPIRQTPGGAPAVPSPPVDELRRLYEEEQMSLVEIGEQFGTSAGPVARWMDEAGIEIRAGWGVSRKSHTSRDGRKHRSRGELKLANWLVDHGISYESDGPIVNNGDRNPCRYDFRVGDTMIEYWGITGSRRYDARKAYKLDLYASEGIDLIEIFPEDLRTGAFETKLARLLSAD
jgi:hypothetical protein